MKVEIKVPSGGESVMEATVAVLLAPSGTTVAKDAELIELETDKVTLEVNAPAAGTIEAHLVAQGAWKGYRPELFRRSQQEERAGQTAAAVPSRPAGYLARLLALQYDRHSRCQLVGRHQVLHPRSPRSTTQAAVEARSRSYPQ